MRLIWLYTCTLWIPSEAGGRAQQASGAAIALEGGGFRALASNTGLIAGLLAACQHGEQPVSLADSGLLDRFGILSSVSGSSWFTSALVFSPQFQALLEGMAASPKTAALQYRTQVTMPWLKATGVDDGKFKLLVALARALHVSIGVTQDTEEAIYFHLTGLSWEHFVDALLNATAGIETSLPLGSPLGTSGEHWAAGKVWLVDHAILLPLDKDPARIYRSKLGIPRVTYHSEASPQPPLHMPAMFSINLGAGVRSTAPLPYVSPAIKGKLGQLGYSSGILFHNFSATSKMLGPNFGHELVEYAGLLPVSRVVAASSAFAGTLCIIGPIPEDFLSLLSGDFVPWIASTAGGQGFAAAEALVQNLAKPGGVTQQSLDQLASAKLHGVIDGGFGDGTGISQAVAAGATDVIAVLNSKNTNDPTYVQRLFAGGVQPRDGNLFPVFSKPLASEVVKLFQGFHSLRISNASRFLKVLAFGTISATTANNSFFGVTAGRGVNITVVNIASTLTIGELEDFNNYNMLVQEMVMAITAQEYSDLVRSSLLPFFSGQGICPQAS